MMMNRRVFASLGIALCAVATSAGALALKNRSTERPRPAAAGKAAAPRPSRQGETAVVSPAGLQQQAAQAPQALVPEHVIYWHIFHHHNFLNRKADEAQRMGRDEEATRLRGFYKREAKLDDGQDAALGQIALEVENEVEALDAQAKRLIDAFRARHPGGALKQGEAMPPPPRELAALQERRNAAVIRARDRLKSVLGDPAFDEFQGFVREKVVPQIKPKSFDSLRPAAPDGGGGQRRQPRNNPFEGRTR
jgi:hypothetical protein